MAEGLGSLLSGVPPRILLPPTAGNQ